MPTGIAQVLGIDRTDSKNLLFETNVKGFPGRQWSINLVGVGVSDLSLVTLMANDRGMNFREQWHGTSLTNVLPIYLYGLMPGVTNSHNAAQIPCV